MKRVLILYGTRFGSTEEVSQEIAKILEKKGISSQVVNLRETKPKEWPSLEGVDGILVGSGIMMNKWTKEPEEFLKKHTNELSKGKILGMFVCSGLAVEDPQKARKMYVEDVSEKLGVNPNLYDAFGGVFDFSETSRMNFLEKKMFKSAVKASQKEGGMTIDENGKNDLRNWDQIRRFAEEFAALMKS